MPSTTDLRSPHSLLHWSRERCQDRESGLTGEWLETNGLGDFAASTVHATATRRYHGLLVARPRGSSRRHVFLTRFEEHVVFPDGTRWPLSAAAYPRRPGAERPGVSPGVRARAVPTLPVPAGRGHRPARGARGPGRACHAGALRAARRPGRRVPRARADVRLPRSRRPHGRERRAGSSAARVRDRLHLRALRRVARRRALVLGCRSRVRGASRLVQDRYVRRGRATRDTPAKRISSRPDGCASPWAGAGSTGARSWRRLSLAAGVADPGEQVARRERAPARGGRRPRGRRCRCGPGARGRGVPDARRRRARRRERRLPVVRRVGSGHVHLPAGPHPRPRRARALLRRPGGGAAVPARGAPAERLRPRRGRQPLQLRGRGPVVRARGPLVRARDGGHGPYRRDVPAGAPGDRDRLPGRQPASVSRWTTAVSSRRGRRS